MSSPMLIHAWLLAAWLSAFHIFHVAILWIKARRKERYEAALRFWLLATFVLGMPLLTYRPTLLWWIPVFLPLVVASLYETWHGRERSMLARLSAVIAASLMTPVSYSVAKGLHIPLNVWVVTALLGAYFIGTVPYVRSLIRGRNDGRWVVASVSWHILGGVGAVWAAWSGYVSWLVVALWVLLTLRTVAIPARQKQRDHLLRPAIIGISEIVLTLLLTAFLLLGNV